MTFSVGSSLSEKVDSSRLRRRYFDLIRIQSTPGTEAEIASYLEKELRAMGLPVTYHWYVSPDGSKRWPSLVTRISTKNYTDSSSPKLLLTGHMDTVEVVKGWKTDPFTPEEDGDLVYGLGSCDMKGGIAAILEVLSVLQEEKVPLKGELVVSFVSDEEGLSRGTYKLLQDGVCADMAIMAECRYAAAALGFRGRYCYKVSFAGLSAHASKYPDLGENAIITASKIAQALESLDTAEDVEMGRGTWIVRWIHGGVRETLCVPDRCEMLVDRYVVPGETKESCEEQILNLTKTFGLQDKVKVELLSRETPFMEGCRIDKEHPLVGILQKHYQKEVGQNLSLVYDPSVCDSNYLMVLGGIPTITFGPSGKGMHEANECGRFSEVLGAARIYVETVREILG